MRMFFKVAVVVTLALGVSACDKCGHWFGQGTPKTCGADAPR